MKIGFMGRTSILVDTIKLILKETNNEVSFIWTSKEEPYYNCNSDVFKNISKSINCPFIYSPSTSSIKELPLADIVISVNFVNIIPEPFLTKFKYGVLNAHSGDLPRYRGNACPNWAIINNENFIKLTVHEMCRELDNGPIYSQSKFKINQNTYIYDIHRWIIEETPKLFLEALQKIECGVKPRKQSGRALRVFPRKPEDGRLDFSKGVDWNYRLIRASSDPFDGAFCYLNNEDTKVVIKRASPVNLGYDFFAIDGQIIDLDTMHNDFVISIGNEALKIEEFIIDDLNKEKSFNLISGSMRNRLI